MSEPISTSSPRGASILAESIFAFDSRSNALLVSNKGTHAADGEVLRIRLPKH